MEQKKFVIDSVSVLRATDFNCHYVKETRKQLADFDSDKDKIERFRKCLCKWCFYFRRERIGGAAMTSIPCGICEKKMMFGSTAVDRLCKDCGDKHELCVQCGGDIKMRVRRKIEFAKGC